MPKFAVIIPAAGASSRFGGKVKKPFVKVDGREIVLRTVELFCNREDVVQTLRLALVEAAEGKIGSPMDQILLFCFHYDAREGRYALAAVKLMRFGGVAAALAVGGLILGLRRRDKLGQVRT